MKTIKSCIFALFMFVLAMPAVTACADDEAMLSDQIVIQKADGESLYFTVEMALTTKQQSYGLMERTTMDPNAGMLFVFRDEKDRTFWMKDTLIPLDMLFIAHDGTIQHIHHMAKPQDKSLIGSERPAQAVLEINGGLCDKLGIKEGDKVGHALFRNVVPQ